MSHPWSTLKPPNPGALSRHTTLSGAGNTQIHQEEDISYVYNISAQGRNGNSNSHRTLIVLNLYLVCGKMSSSWHEMTVVRTNTVKPTRATARSQTYTAWVYHLQDEMGKDCLPITTSTNFVHIWYTPDPRWRMEFSTLIHNDSRTSYLVRGKMSSSTH